MRITNLRDANFICTAITIGFIRNEISRSKPPKTVIEYSEDRERESYEEVKRKLHDLGVDFTLTKSISQRELYYVIAKPTDFNPGSINLANWKYLQDIEQLANEQRPYGAYIGGMTDYQNNHFHIIGPSKIGIYHSDKRTATREEQRCIDEKLEEAVENARKALTCLSGEHPLYNIAPEMEVVEEIEEGPDQEPKLFKSYHGMIRAMNTFVRNRDQYFFEIALGPETSKVSSCIPCAIYMTAAGFPPSSTHLGRGDNWNIPKPSSEVMKSISNYYRSRWEQNVTEYFITGVGLLDSKIGESGSLVDYLKGESNLIPEYFLIALTYECKFTERILSILS